VVVVVVVEVEVVEVVEVVVVEVEVELVVEVVCAAEEIELKLSRVEDSVNVDEVNFDDIISEVEEIEVGPADEVEAECKSELFVGSPTASVISGELVEGFEYSSTSDSV